MPPFQHTSNSSAYFLSKDLLILQITAVVDDEEVQLARQPDPLSTLQVLDLLTPNTQNPVLPASGMSMIPKPDHVPYPGNGKGSPLRNL